MGMVANFEEHKFLKKPPPPPPPPPKGNVSDTPPSVVSNVQCHNSGDDSFLGGLLFGWLLGDS